VEGFRAIGMREFVVFWPERHQVRIFERAVEKVLPALRQT